jgi:hypothetical protein
MAACTETIYQRGFVRMLAPIIAGDNPGGPITLAPRVGL